MFNKLLLLLAGVYILQSVGYYYISSKHYKNANKEISRNQLILPQNLDYVIQMENSKKKSMDEDLWICTAYRFGGNITPSIIHNKEYWRYFTCFFLHFNIYHFLINVLIIWYYSNNTELNCKIILLFTTINIILANITSSLISPDSLKIGSSSLSVSLLCFSLFSHLNKQIDSSVFIDIALLLMFICGFFSKSVDNAVHVSSFINTLIFILFKRKKFENLYFGLAGVYLLTCGFIISNLKLSDEQTLAVLINYGCQE